MVLMGCSNPTEVINNEELKDEDIVNTSEYENEFTNGVHKTVDDLTGILRNLHSSSANINAQESIAVNLNNFNTYISLLDKDLTYKYSSTILAIENSILHGNNTIELNKNFLESGDPMVQSELTDSIVYTEGELNNIIFNLENER